MQVTNFDQKKPVMAQIREMEVDDRLMFPFSRYSTVLTTTHRVKVTHQRKYNTHIAADGIEVTRTE